jgi:thioredoxin-related protein
MNKYLIWATLFAPLFSTAQERGIYFEQDGTWQQILGKAKAEDKYVFVDCYASWFAPCKTMDREVYMNDTVGKFMNDNFICVKVQMDTTQTDSKKVQNWYKTAYDIGKQYSVHAYPSFLFFSPDGFIAYKSAGAKSKEKFLEVAKTGMSLNQGNYSLKLKKYNEGSLICSDMRDLADDSKRMGLDSMAMQIARDYISHYLTGLSLEELWTKENIGFLRSHSKAIHYEDGIFQVYLRDRKKIDSVMDLTGYSNRLINYVIYEEEIKPRISLALKSHTEPKWKSMERAIEKKYTREYVKNDILDARVEFYGKAKKWHKYARFFVIRSENAGISNVSFGRRNAILLNNTAFEVFKYSNSKRELNKALSWVNKAIKMDEKPYPEAIDTKANILYKMGRGREALFLEAKSANLDPHNSDIQENFSKMKSGLPTWSTE